MWECLKGLIFINGNILRFVAASAAEVENGGYFVTGQDIIILQNATEKWSTHRPLHKYSRKTRHHMELQMTKSSNSDNVQRIYNILGFVSQKT